MTRILLLCSLSLALPLSGCGGTSGPELAEVSGTVTIDGKPAEGVRVNFMPDAGGRASSATTDADGSYTLAYSSESSGAVVGAHKVTITPPEPGVEADTAVTNEPLTDKSIPQEYLEMKKPVEVKAGSNTIDLTYP